MLAMQTAICFLYGFLFKVPPRTSTALILYGTSIQSAVTTIGFFVIVLLGNEWL